MKHSVRFVLTLVLCLVLSLSGVLAGVRAARGVETSTGTVVNAGLTTTNVRSLAINPLTPTSLFAGTSGGGVFRYDAVSSYALVLSSSWNLVSVSVPLPVSSIPGLQAVYAYHDGWSVPATLTPGEAYWVQVQNAVTVPLPGSPSTAPVALTYQAGWQLLGNPFDIPILISSIINHDLITTCYSFGPAWGILNPSTDSLQPGKGYWIQLSASTTLTLGATVLPDLTVDTLYFEPAQPTVGGSVTFNFTIRNQGLASVAADYTVYVYVDGVPEVTGGTDTDRLASGASQEWYWDTTWPSDTASHTFMVVLDPTHVITESNESNNSASLSASAGSVMYPLTTTASPSAGGTIGRSPNAASYASGTVVTLTANANPGYHFVNWSGDLTGTTNPTTITMAGNKTVIGVFQAETLAPAPPDLLSPTDKTVLSTLTPALSWTTVPGATQYRVTIWPTSYSSLYLVDELLATTSYVVPTGILSSFDEYGWTVRARNSLGWSVNATFPGLTSLPTFTVQAPTQLVAQTQLNGTFRGSKHDTIFKLANGQFWQQTSYDYKLATYAFWPDVTIYYDSGLYKMTIEGVDGYVLVTRLQQVIESELVDSSFTGSTHGTVFNLTNGQVWQQTSYDYVLGTYAYRPDVTIFYLNGGFKLKIEGVDTPVGVARLL